MKKTIFVLGLFLTMNTNAMAKGFNGPYIGGGTGYTNSSIKWSEHDESTTYKDSSEGYEIDAFLGYGKSFGSWYFGPELGYFFSNADSGTYHSMDATKGLQISGRIGYLFSNTTMVYGRLGYTRTEFETSYNYDSNGFLVGPNNRTTSYTKNGWVTGVGIEHQLTDSFSVLGEYQISRYGTITLRPNAAGGAAALDVEPSYNVFKLGVIYHFS